jgi:hypothetical protein
MVPSPSCSLWIINYLAMGERNRCGREKPGKNVIYRKGKKKNTIKLTGLLFLDVSPIEKVYLVLNLMQDLNKYKQKQGINLNPSDRIYFKNMLVNVHL